MAKVAFQFGVGEWLRNGDGCGVVTALRAIEGEPHYELALRPDARLRGRWIDEKLLERDTEIENFLSAIQSMPMSELNAQRTAVLDSEAGERDYIKLCAIEHEMGRDTGSLTDITIALGLVRDQLLVNEDETSWRIVRNAVDELNKMGQPAVIAA